jgi:hypothetical protein
MEAVRTSETSVDNHCTRQYNPEDSSEHHFDSFTDIKIIIKKKKVSTKELPVCHSAEYF